MPSKKCTGCKETKELESFYKHKKSKTGVRPACKECHRKYSKNYRQTEENVTNILNTRFKRVYGITAEEYNEMLTEQNSCCAVCGKTDIENKKRLAVDHNHKTGQVRSLLCSNCNTAIGMVDENEDILVSLISYLREHNGKTII